MSDYDPIGQGADDASSVRPAIDAQEQAGHRGRHADARIEPRHHERTPALRHTRHHHAPQERQERQAVLVDARFWAWLHDDEAADADVEAARQGLQDLLQAHGARLLRALWYSDRDADRAAPGLQVRRVPSNAQDQGVTMLRAMAQDLAALAEHRAVDRVLLVSDDDRLLLAVDEAQRRGLMVDMLVDRESQDLKALAEDEPHWASLLMQADRLLVLGHPESRLRSGRPRQGNQPDNRAEHRARREPPSAEASGIIEDEVLRWWDDESSDQRDHWRLEVQATRGIPQELDRQLLLRISRRLGQALSPAEKAAMRQTVRQQVLGEGAAAPRTPEDA